MKKRISPILITALIMLLVFLLLSGGVTAMLLTGWKVDSNPLTREINRTLTINTLEKAILEETEVKVDLIKVRRAITDEEEIALFEDPLLYYVEEPGFVATWFEYLLSDEWNFSDAAADILTDVDGDTYDYICLCAKYGYPEFAEEYGDLLPEEEEEDEEEEEEDEEEEEYLIRVDFKTGELHWVDEEEEEDDSDDLSEANEDDIWDEGEDEEEEEDEEEPEEDIPEDEEELPEDEEDLPEDTEELSENEYTEGEETGEETD